MLTIWAIRNITVVQSRTVLGPGVVDAWALQQLSLRFEPPRGGSGDSDVPEICGGATVMDGVSTTKKTIQTKATKNPRPVRAMSIEQRPDKSVELGVSGFMT